MPRLRPSNTFRFGFASLSAIATIACIAAILARKASAGEIFISFDEWGKGYICGTQIGVTPPAVPPCGGPRPGVGLFLRLASGFTADPTPGGGTNVLTYLLPAPMNFGSSFDILLFDAPSSADGDTDQIRILGDRILIYSTQQSTGQVDCTRNPSVDPNNPNLGTGCDGLADVKTLPGFRGGFQDLEFGPDGMLGGPGGMGPVFGEAEIFDIPGIALIFVSDEGTAACGAATPCAPPPNNPFRDITGLNVTPGQVTLGFGANFNPIDTPIPEPRPVSLFFWGAILLAAYHRLRRYSPRKRH
jgi:hypothetical protein